MKFKAKTVFAKIEDTYNVDSLPGETDAVVTKNLSINPYTGDTVSRDVDRPALGNQETINVNPYVEITFDVEIAGSGVAGTAPGYGPLLRACGLSEVINAGTDVQYSPVSSTYESVTLSFERKNRAGTHQVHKSLGCRGSVSFGFSKNQLPMMSFKFIGFYVRPVDAAVTVPDYSAYIDPIAISEAQTSMDIGGYSPVAEEFSIDLANATTARNVVNHRECLITDRAPSGSTTIEAPDISVKDFFALVESHNGVTTQAVEFIHGTAAGNIFQINTPKVQLQTPSESDSDGELHYQMGMSLLPVTTDDELLITIK